mmetsp:Transcript_132447/g.186982  ORF Transcript_132447/g.186982 Transcript_132447/m.186982 type:complete len:84 (+) Transcript_132447:79-330(+)
MPSPCTSNEMVPAPSGTKAICANRDPSRTSSTTQAGRSSWRASKRGSEKDDVPPEGKWRLQRGVAPVELMFENDAEVHRKVAA